MRLTRKDIGKKCDCCGIPMTTSTDGLRGHVVGKFDISGRRAVCDICAYKYRQNDNGLPGKCPVHPDEDMIILYYQRGEKKYYRRICRLCFFERASHKIKARIFASFPGFPEK